MTSRGIGLTHLRAQDETDEFVPVDPVQLANDSETSKVPPRVAHVLELFRATVQTAVGQLPLAEPPAQHVAVDTVELAQNREGSDADPDCKLAWGTKTRS